MVADAVFLREAERAAIAALFPGFLGIWLEAPLPLLHARIAARSGDASDADVAVLEATAAHDPGHMTWRPLNAAEGTEAALRKMLDAPPPASP